MIDSVSTLNFLDLQTAKKMGCKLMSICPLKVAVPGNHNLTSTHSCRGFEWELKGHKYSTDVMILPMGRCEMVLGIQWLSTLGNIQGSFKQLTMEFQIDAKKRVLTGIQTSQVEWMNGKQMEKAGLSAMALCVFPWSLFNVEVGQDQLVNS